MLVILSLKSYDGKKEKWDMSSIRLIIKSEKAEEGAECEGGLMRMILKRNWGYLKSELRITAKMILFFISDIYNEREDFLWKMFGMKLRIQESEDYWGE